MINDHCIQQIRRLRAEGHTLRDIALAVHVAIGTVTKYLADPELKQDRTVTSFRKSKLKTFSDQELKEIYISANGNSRVMLRLLKERAAKKGKADFTLNESSVRRYYRAHFPELKPTVAPVINFFHIEVGEQLQIDFVETKFTFAGMAAPVKVYIFEAVYTWSRKAFVRVCPDITQNSWMMSIAECLRTYGVPMSILCDNDRSLVIGRKQGKAVFHPAFVWLCKPLGIRLTACQVRHPQTKGRIERFGRYLQENGLVWAQQHRDEIATLHDLNEKLQAWNAEEADRRRITIDDGRNGTVKAFYEQEKALLRFPEGLDEVFAVECKQILSNGQGCVYLHGNEIALGYHSANRDFCLSITSKGRYLISDHNGKTVRQGTVSETDLHNYRWNAPPAATAGTGAANEEQTPDPKLTELANLVGL